MNSNLFSCELNTTGIGGGSDDATQQSALCHTPEEFGCRRGVFLQHRTSGPSAFWRTLIGLPSKPGYLMNCPSFFRFFYFHTELTFLVSLNYL